MVRDNNIDNLLLCTILHAVHGNLYRLTLRRRNGTRHIEYSMSACGRRCSSVCPNSIRTFPGTCWLSLLFFVCTQYAAAAAQSKIRRDSGCRCRVLSSQPVSRGRFAAFTPQRNAWRCVAPRALSCVL